MTATAVSRTTFPVIGLTCAHCVAAISAELRALPGVHDVAVTLVPDGVSAVTVTATRPPEPAAVAAALDEAGNYQLG